MQQSIDQWMSSKLDNYLDTAYMSDGEEREFEMNRQSIIDLVGLDGIKRIIREQSLAEEEFSGLFSYFCGTGIMPTPITTGKIFAAKWIMCQLENLFGDAIDSTREEVL